MAAGWAVRWDGDRVAAAYREQFGRKVHAVALMVQARAKRLLSVPGTGARKGGAIVPAGPKDRKRIYGAFPSKPGEPPRKQTGRLRGSVAVAMQQKGLTARVGTNVKYGRFLELGCRNMAARPWLRRALREEWPNALRVLTGP